MPLGDDPRNLHDEIRSLMKIDRQNVRFIDREITLPKTEVRILTSIRSGRRGKTCADIVEDIYFDDPNGGPDQADKTVHALIYRIKKKLPALGLGIDHVTGGYIFVRKPVDKMPKVRVKSYSCRDWIRVASPSSAPAPSIKIADVLALVSLHTRVPISMMKADTRQPDAVRARHIAMFIARHHAGHLLTRIAMTMGDRDHSTIRYAVRKMGALIEEDPQTASEVGKIVSALERRNAA